MVSSKCTEQTTRVVIVELLTSLKQNMKRKEYDYLSVAIRQSTQMTNKLTPMPFAPITKSTVGIFSLVEN